MRRGPGVTVNDFYEEILKYRQTNYEEVVNTSSKHQQTKKARISPLVYTGVYTQTRVYSVNVGGKTKHQVFVSGLHTSADHPFIKFLEEVIGILRPQQILVERPKSFSSDRLKCELLKDRTSYSEIDYLIELSLREGIDIHGMDMPEPDRFKILIEKYGYPVTLLYLFLLTPPPRKTEHRKIYWDIAFSNMLNQILYNEVFDPYVDGMPEGTHLIEFVEKDIRTAARRFLGTEKLEDYLGDIKYIGPYPHYDYCEMNRVSTYWDAHRNFHMAETCTEALDKYDRVLAVAGGWHIQTLKNSLKRMLDEKYNNVEMVDWLSYASK